MALRYDCLSHYWSTTSFQNITIQNSLLANKRGIRISDLPKSFRDAILVARSLHIDYRWIDSMCIVQDNQADWEFHVDADGRNIPECFHYFGRWR
jgi:heterokaryon incompatibility protein (HET)